MTRIEIFKTTFRDQIEWFDRESRKHKRRHRQLRPMVFVLAVVRHEAEG